MPRPTKEEQMQLWLLSAKALTDISTCTSKHTMFRNGYPMADNDLLRDLVRHHTHIIDGPGPGEKMRTFFGPLKFAIPVTSETQYSRLQPCETLAIIHMSLGLNDATPENLKPLFESVKERPETKALYLNLEGFTFPTDGPNKGVFEQGFTHWFEAAGLPKDSAVHAITGRLYHTNATLGKDELPRSRVAEFVTSIMDVATRISALEEVRAELKDLSAVVHSDMRSNLESFKLDADDSHDEDEDPDSAAARKKQRVMDKEERDQTVHVHSIEAKTGRGLKDSRDERLAPFKGEVAPHFFELWYAILFTWGSHDRTQRAVAPRYSEGAELLLRNGKFDFEEPSANAEGSTIITQKINCLPQDQQDKMKNEYLKAHDLAHSVNQLTKELMAYLRYTLAMSICLEDKHGNVLCEIREDSLEVIQKAALFNVFMTNIWKVSKPGDEDDAEEADSESDSSDEDEDEGEEYYDKGGSSSDESDESDDACGSDEDGSGAEGSGAEGSDDEAKSSGSDSED